MDRNQLNRKNNEEKSEKPKLMLWYNQWNWQSCLCWPHAPDSDLDLALGSKQSPCSTLTLPAALSMCHMAQGERLHSSLGLPSAFLGGPHIGWALPKATGQWARVANPKRGYAGSKVQHVVVAVGRAKWNSSFTREGASWQPHTTQAFIKERSGRQMEGPFVRESSHI